MVGLDYSTSVLRAERCRTSPDVHFVRGDLQRPPFALEVFDVILSNGVLHHSPNTYKTFVEVAKLAKAGGRFYLWLYRKQDMFNKRYILYPVVDLARMFVSRTPERVQRLMVEAFALTTLAVDRVRGRPRDTSWQERVVGAFDSMTPRWRHYHTPLEVSYWFFLNGYSSACITHWDNPYGFGMVAVKKPQEDAPGVNFGKTGVVRRYWT